MKNKKGSHVGMILSFTMFIVFLIFAYVIVVSPIDSKKQNEDVFETIKIEIIKEISGLVYTSRINNTDNIGGCIEILNPDYDFSERVVIVKNKSGEIASEIVGNTILIPGGLGFVKAYYSDNFFENTGSFSGADCVSVEVDSISSEKRILEKKIISFIEEMEANYSIVKNNFGIPSNVDFHVQFEYADGTNITSGEFKELKTEIFAKQVSINYLDKYANEKIGSLIIKIW